ncbi:FCD domain-containing protein [Rhodobacteraceae bacterium NNCM2]|nr:FCD domain-containing protein [Coraliihabitans acroporae]
MPFKKIAAEKISTTIVRQIEELILQGVLRPGDRLPAERELAERMEVSRPTLREALAELEESGLIAARPGGGTFVADVLGSAFAPPLITLFASHDTALFDYIAFRRDVEGMAAAQAAERATETDLGIIRSVFDRFAAASSKRNHEEAARLDAEFHMAVVESAHNVVMTHVMRSLYELLVEGVFYNRRVIYGLPAGRDALLEQHRAIMEGVASRDSDAARRAVEAHLDYVRDALRESDRMRTREEISALRQRHEETRAAKPRQRKTG